MRSKKWAATSRTREGVRFISTCNANPLKGFNQVIILL